jgi:hypothetical protein
MGHVAGKGKMRNEYRVFIENRKGRDRLDVIHGVDGKIILK